MNHYTYRVAWSQEYGEYVARCVEMPWLSRWAPAPQAAVAAAAQAVDEHVTGLTAGGGYAPEPIGERGFSGKFIVRTSPTLHARLAVEAAEQNVSMNQWVVQKLADRPVSLDW